MVDVKFKSEKDIFQEQVEQENKVDEILENKKGDVLDQIEKEKNPVIKIMKTLDFEDLKLKVLQTNTFCIGTKDKVEGQILFSTGEQKQKFILARIVRRIDESGKEAFLIYFFNEQIPRGQFVWKTIEAEFYLSKLITKEKTYQLFSTEKLDTGEYDIWGTEIEALDYIDLGNYSRIGKKQPLLFVHTAFPKTNAIQTKKEFFKRFEKYDLTEDKLIDWIYTSPQGWVYEYPKSFCYVQLANILGCRDDFNPFHLPVLMIGETGTGKTTATQLIFKKFNENFEWIKMTGSTLKGLVPSFANPTALKPGLFLEAKRYAPIDEFFPGVSKLHQDEKGEVLENIKDVLDYEEGAYRSGHGNMSGQMKAEHIALTNPKSYGNNILQLSRKFEPEILARYFIWYISKSQKDFIKIKKDEGMKRGDYSFMAQEDFLEGVDYLKSFNCDYDNKKIREICDIGENFLKSKGDDYDNVKAFYSSRYYEHCCKLIDALTKLRCWVEGDKSFKSKPQDYALVKELLLEMLECWSIDFFISEYKKI